MLKKVYLISLSFLLLLALTIPSFAAVSPEAPEGATPIAIPWTARYLYRMRSNAQWYSSDHTPTVEDFYGDNGVSDDQIAVVPSVVFEKNRNVYYLQGLMTYHMEYIVSSVPDDAIDFWAYNTNINEFRFVPHATNVVFGQIENSLVSSDGPYNSTFLFQELGITDTAIGITGIGSSSYKIQFTFSTPLQFDDMYQIYGICFPSTGFLSEPGNFVLTDFVAYSDPRGSYFDQLQLQATIANMELLYGILENGTLTNEQLSYVGQALGEQIDLIEHQNELINSQNGYLGQQNSMLQGDPNDYQDDSGFDSAAGELEDLENEINDQITQDVTLPDGSSHEMNGELIGDLKEDFMDRWDPQDYEASAGREIARIFDMFYPYVGVAIFLNLTLAVILSFLRGRANA
jgi:hypothetical protein